MTEKLPVQTIQLRPIKKVGLVLGAISSLLVCLLFVNLGYDAERPSTKLLCLLILVAALGVLFFNIAAYVYLRKENFVGFFISSEGLNDISTGHNYGVIQWKDVTKIRVLNDVEHLRHQYIVLKVRNPLEYIDRESTQTKKRSLSLKLHYYGSPICFSNRGLDCSFNELETLVRTYYDNYKKREEELRCEEWGE